MKGGLCVIYTSLLTISVLSSCALFILVVSEALQGDGGVDSKVDLSGLHNVSQKTEVIDEEVAPDDRPETQFLEDTNMVGEHEMTFPDTLALNSVTTDGLPDTGHPPVLVSLADNAKLELRHPEELLFGNDSEEHNETKIFSIIDGDTILDETENLPVEVEKEKESTEPRITVKAKSLHETRQVEEAFQAPLTDPESVTESQTEEPTEQDTSNIPVKPETPQEDIPSFAEWAQKQLAEAEKKDTVLNHSSQPSHSNTNFSSKSTKLRSKNYASPACGAKVVAVNPEAGSASSILSPNRDEYMLNTCNSRIWFVVELCEAVQAQKIEIANFELFSSTPKDIAVYFSDRFPTRDWASVGQFTAQDMRDVQSFDLYPHLFGKFIKVEMLSHHGSEHYCPVSLFKVYGTSEFEVLEKENSQHSSHIDEDEDDEIIDVPDIPTVDTEPSKNLFGSARDAVMSIMKKAAQALVKSEVPKNVSSEHNDTSTDKAYKRCCSPSHIIVCDNCSETLYHEVYELISCSSDRLMNLVRQVFLRDTLKCTGMCQPYGLDFKSTKTIEFSSERVAYINALFPQTYIAALCNILAIKEKKVVMNSSFETELNVTMNVTVDDTPKNVNSETNGELDIKLVPDKNNVPEDNEINVTVLPEERTTSEVVTEGTNVPIETTKEQNDLTNENIEEAAAVEEKPVQDTQEDQSDIQNANESLSDSEYKDSDQKSEIKNGKIDIINEKSKETVLEENNDQIIIDSDNLVSDFDQMAIDPTPPGVPASQNQPQTTLQKESVFLRLSNRVKTLERNMSLSGQYLEELSKRYKKQVEEMQKTFEKTISQMTEERKKSNDREQKYIDQMTILQEQLSQMTAAIHVLMEDRDSWFGNLSFIKFLVFQAIIIAAAFYVLSKRRKVEPVIIPIVKKTKKKEKLRRKSVEGVSGHATPSAKKRRPSEEALQIARQSTDDVGVDEDGGEWQVARKNRRRKTSILHRTGEMESSNEWARQDSIGELHDNPIPLDEEEFYAPVPEPKVFNEIETPTKRNLPKSNGSFFNNLKNKTMKTRRLSSPAFLRTLSRQSSSRSTPSPVVRTLEPVFNGGLNKKESPTGSLWSDSTEISQNGQENGGTKKKKSLKNYLKKVF